MAETATHLYRALMGDDAKNFKIKTPRSSDTANSLYPGDGVLYPQFEEKTYYSNKLKRHVTRPPDVDVVAGKDGPEVKANGRGTSLHDKPNWFASKEFWIPIGTIYSEEIVIRKDEDLKWNGSRSISGHHYQLEPKNQMTQISFQGHLDNMARAAIVRQIALAKLGVHG